MRLETGSFFQLSTFRKPRRFRTGLALVTLLACMNLFVGCYYFYVKKAPVATDALAQAQMASKYIIIHHKDSAWHVTSLRIDLKNNTLHGVTEPVAKNHQFYKSVKPKKSIRYKVHEGNPMKEVHIYADSLEHSGANEFSLPMASVNRVDLFEKDQNATTASWVFGTIGIALGVLILIAIIVALTKSSCPFVYSYDGTGYHFNGEMYGGAIYPKLERDDYMPLAGIKPSNGKLSLRISNELLEKQYTNLARLLVVDHPEGTRVLADRNGNMHTISKPVSPVMARSDWNQDYTTIVANTDSSSCLFNDNNEKQSAMNSLVLTFVRPKGVQDAKLVLNAKNSLWLDYIFGKFYEQFGDYYAKFAEKQKKVAAKKHRKWSLEQGIPLSVYVKTAAGWKFHDSFEVIGPLASRDLVMPLDLSDVPGDTLWVKLETGFMFWEVDYAAVDFTANVPVQVSDLAPSLAIDEKGNLVGNLLDFTDDKYLVQPEPGNEVTLEFPEIPPVAGNDRTCFLHSRGYYEYIRDFKGKPDLLYLNSFKKPGAFTRFSKKEYSKILESYQVTAYTNGK